MIEEQGIPEYNASLVAKAICIASAATPISEQRNTAYRHSLHASFFKKSLNGQADKLPEVVEDEGTPDLLAEAEDTKSWEKDFLKDQLKRQNEELEFLRAALRHLVVPPAQQEKSLKKEEESDPRNPVEEQEAIEPPTRGIISRLPSTIEIHQTPQADDDQSEQMSELQSPSVIVLRHPSKNSSINRRNTPQWVPDLPNPITSLALEKKFELLEQNFPQRPLPPVCLQTSFVDSSKESVSGNASYMKSVQLVVELRRKQNQTSYTFTDMKKGEVLDGRARSLKFQLYFEQRGVYVEGLYSGAIRKGLPHGMGVLRFNNRDLYIGSFEDGKMHGEGTLLSRCDSGLASFRGTFKNNEFVEKSAVAKPVSSIESASAVAA
eukprot:scaffold1489_cov194-Cylindrotheca_fusiformis.AAC.15